MIHTDLRDGYDPSMHGRYGRINYLFCGNPVDLRPGHEFLSFASKRLPELSRCLQHDFSPVLQDQFYRRSLAAREVIESNGKALGVVSSTVLTEIIIVFLWIALASDMDEQIALSITGLKWLYQYLRLNEDNDGATFRSRAENEQIALVFGALSGSREPSSS